VTLLRDTRERAERRYRAKCDQMRNDAVGNRERWRISGASGGLARLSVLGFIAISIIDRLLTDLVL
jgi:hypothetical protein